MDKSREVVGKVLIHLKVISQNLQIIKRYAHANDQYQLDLLVDSVNDATKEVSRNAVSVKTRNLLYFLDIKFDSSRHFLASLETERSKVAITRVLASVDTLYELLEFGKDPIGKKYHAILNQLEETFYALSQQENLPDDFIAQITNEALQKKLRSAMAEASARGDSPSVSKAAASISCNIFAIYNLLQSAQRNYSARRYIFEILLLNERLSKEAEVSPEECKSLQKGQPN